MRRRGRYYKRYASCFCDYLPVESLPWPIIIIALQNACGYEMNIDVVPYAVLDFADIVLDAR